MSEDKMTRRGFLSWALAGASFLALSILGCGKKEEKKPGEETTPSAPEMTEEQKQEYVFANCICKKCPSYVECEERGGFCWVGKSTCIKEKKGCICPECPVTAKLNLKWGYYCLNGSAKDLMEKEKTQG
jgi:hypothetical protein